MKELLKSLPLLGPIFRLLGKIRWHLLGKWLWKYRLWKSDAGRHLWKILRDERDLSVVQIGSNDGVSGDPISRLLRRNNTWQALLVEPVPFLFERLRKNYAGHPHVRLENVAITRQAAAMTFHYVKPSARDTFPDLPSWFDQLGSFDREHITRHLGTRIEPFIVGEKVATLTLPELFARHGLTHIDLMHVDTEGFEWKILQQLDLTKFQPRWILFEHTHLPPDDRAAATAFFERRYQMTELGGDTLCVRK